MPARSWRSSPSTTPLRAVIASVRSSITRASAYRAPGRQCRLDGGRRFVVHGDKGRANGGDRADPAGPPDRRMRPSEAMTSIGSRRDTPLALVHGALLLVVVATGLLDMALADLSGVLPIGPIADPAPGRRGPWSGAPPPGSARRPMDDGRGRRRHAAHRRPLSAPGPVIPSRPRDPDVHPARCTGHHEPSRRRDLADARRIGADHPVGVPSALAARLRRDRPRFRHPHLPDSVSSFRSRRCCTSCCRPSSRSP